MATYTAITKKRLRGETGSLSYKLATEFGLIATLLSGASATTNTLTITKTTITLAAATKLNLDGDTEIDGFFNMGAQGTGIAVTTANPFVMEVHAKTGSDLTAGSTGLSCGLRCRYEVGHDQTNQISMIALEGRLRPKKDLGDGCHAGVSGTIEASEGAACVLGGTSTTQRSAGNFCVELGENVTCTSGWLTGVTIDSSTHSGVSMASCTYAGLRIKTSSGKEVWEHGIYLDDASATTGITLGSCTTGIDLTGATTKGINISGAASTAQLYIGGTAILASGEQAIYVNCTAETAATNGIWVTLKSTVTTGDLTGARIKAHTLRETSGGPNVRGVYAQAMSDTADKFAAMLQGGLFVAGYTGANTTATSIYGVTGFISQGEGLLACTTLAAVQAHLQTRGDETITTHTGVLITNEAVGGNGRTMNSAIRITETNMGGGTKSFDVLIDATGVNTTVHDTDQTDLIKFRDSGGTERKVVFDPTNNTVLEVQTA